MLITTPSARDF